jgi:hypothetical protein
LPKPGFDDQVMKDQAEQRKALEIGLPTISTTRGRAPGNLDANSSAQMIDPTICRRAEVYAAEQSGLCAKCGGRMSAPTVNRFAILFRNQRFASPALPTKRFHHRHGSLRAARLLNRSSIAKDVAPSLSCRRISSTQPIATPYVVIGKRSKNCLH